jgi:hypothetical protein
MHSFRTNSLPAALFSKSALLSLGLLAMVWLPSQAQAQVNATLIPAFTPGTPSTYQYVIGNLGPDAIGEFDLAVPATFTLTDVTAPTGWLALYTPGDSFISWESTSSATDVPGPVPGGLSVLGGFSFMSDAPAGTDDYLLLDYNTGDTEGGIVLGPVAAPPPPPSVPEASTTVSLGLLLALGLGGMAISARRRKAV